MVRDFRWRRGSPTEERTTDYMSASQSGLQVTDHRKKKGDLLHASGWRPPTRSEQGDCRIDHFGHFGGLTQPASLTQALAHGRASSTCPAISNLSRPGAFRLPAITAVIQSPPSANAGETTSRGILGGTARVPSATKAQEGIGLSPRCSIEWVRNIDRRQDKTAPGDLVELGLVARMNRRHRDHQPGAELGPKRLQLPHELVPGVRSRGGNSCLPRWPAPASAAPQE